MSATTEIEKKSLEAHVELCAERYKNLDNKLDTVEQRVGDVEQKMERKMASMEAVLDEIKDMITIMQQQRSDQIITWGLGIIGTLVGVIAFLVWNVIGH